MSAQNDSIADKCTDVMKVRIFKQLRESLEDALAFEKGKAHGRCKPPSFPRKACPELAEGRESTPQTFGNALSKDWIPAFAGMTEAWSARVSLMTPLPGNG
jgi:hypothetical protein